MVFKNPIPTIWTIGHSTRSLKEFVTLLQDHNIKLLADIRYYPGSGRYPQFDKEGLERSMPENGIKYIHLMQLGGRRKANPNSLNGSWRHPAFRGYADYMETDEFKAAINRLEGLASAEPTVIMCSEAVWWSCHRSLVADYLKARGWKVLHIMAPDKVQEHPYTAPARIVDGELTYHSLL